MNESARKYLLRVLVFGFPALMLILALRERTPATYPAVAPYRPPAVAPAQDPPAVQSVERPPAVAPAQEPGLAEKLAIIAGTPSRDRDRVARRFAFLLDASARMCLPEEDPAALADVLVFIHGEEFRDAGLDDGLLDVANSLHRLTSEVYAIAGRTPPAGCTHMWAI